MSVLSEIHQRTQRHPRIRGEARALQVPQHGDDLHLVPLGQGLRQIEGGGDRASDPVGVVEQERDLHGGLDHSDAPTVALCYHFVVVDKQRVAYPISTTRAQAGGASGTWSGSFSSQAAPRRGNSPTTVRHPGRAAGHGVWPSVSTTTTSGRGRAPSALAKPVRRSVPPPPTSGIPS